jgi:hypothetical protein
MQNHIKQKALLNTIFQNLQIIMIWNTDRKNWSKEAFYDYGIVNASEVEKRRMGGTPMTNWWPVSDEEWERQNFPERFK